MRSEKVQAAFWVDRLVSNLLGGAARLFFALRRTPPIEDARPGKAKSLFLVRPEGLGDIVLTLPAIAWLRRVYPGARITMAVRPMFADFTRGAAVVDEVVILDYPKKSTFSFLELPRFIRQVWGLRARFDVAYDFRGDARNAILGAWSSRVVVGIAAPETRFLLSAVYAGERGGAEAAFILEIVGLSELTAPVMGKDAGDYRFQIPDSAMQSAAGLLGGQKDFILVHAGASRPSNRWNPAKWQELIGRLLDEGNTVVLTGAGAEEGAQVRAAVQGLEERDRLVNLVDRTSGAQLAALVDMARAVISPDTGVAHIAFARGTPAVTMFGSDSDAQWGHRTAISRTLGVSLPCRPCRAYVCPRSDFPMECMERIEADAVESALEMVWKGQAASSCSGTGQPGGLDPRAS
jgi:ADP-heptose:LPS heptosyltransferase